jgi:hypothetical protein
MPTVVRITSLSFTGTTWINVLLGCHKRGFVLGPPDRVVNLLYDEPDQAAQACRIHRDECTFWPGFFERFDRDGNFYVQLAEASDTDVIVINNAIPDARADQHLRHPDVVVRDVVVTRDGRATVARYLRTYPETTLRDAIETWFLPSARNLPFNLDDRERLCVNYEHVVADQFTFIERAGKFLGVDYPEGSHRFWEFDLHASAGNHGVLDMCRIHQGLRAAVGRRAELEDRYQKLVESPDKPVQDERWKDDLSARELIAFDYFAGDLNERWGYERDRFTPEQVRAFEKEFGLGYSTSFAASSSPSQPHAQTDT